MDFETVGAKFTPAQITIDLFWFDKRAATVVVGAFSRGVEVEGLELGFVEVRVVGVDQRTSTGVVGQGLEIKGEKDAGCGVGSGRSGGSGGRVRQASKRTSSCCIFYDSDVCSGGRCERGGSGGCGGKQGGVEEGLDNGRPVRNGLGIVNVGIFVEFLALDQCVDLFHGHRCGRCHPGGRLIVVQ